jgi:hypothetical protein
MDIVTVMQFRTAADSQKIAALTPRLGELRREMKGYETWMIANANDADVVAKIRAKMKRTEAEIADVEKQIRTIKEWKRPTYEQLRKINQLQSNLLGFEITRTFAESAMKKAEYEERPKAAAEARKQFAEAQAECPKAMRELRKAIEKLGLDPTPLCGEAV